MFAVLLVCLMVGCANPTSTVNAPQPGHGIDEFQQLASESAAAVLGSLRSLELVNAQGPACPAKVIAGFAEEVEHLQVESIRVRARAQAIQTRGDAYFEAWAGSLNPTNGIPVSQASAVSIPQVRESLSQIKSASDEVRTAFRPFFSNLRILRLELEANPRMLETPEAHNLIRTTREQGLRVVQTLGVLRDELEAFRPVLTKIKAATNL